MSLEWVPEGLLVNDNCTEPGQKTPLNGAMEVGSSARVELGENSCGFRTRWVLEIVIAALPDPLLLSANFSDADRITAKVAATRRDRLTAWLPMLRPPHNDGGPCDPGRDTRLLNGSQATEVIGAIDYPSAVSGALASISTEWLLEQALPYGAWSLGMIDDPVPWLQELEARGVTAAIYEGISGG